MATIDKIFGLDLSYTCTGIAWVRPANEEDTYYDKIVTRPGDFDCSIQRALHITSIIMKEVTKDSICFIEDYALNVGRGKKGSGAKNLTLLAELNGLIKLAILRRTGHPALTVSISQWKKFLCNEYNLNKDSFKLRVYQKFGADCATNDEAAAIGVADFGYHIVLGLVDPLEGRRELTKYERDTIAKYYKNNDLVLQSLATRFLS